MVGITDQRGRETRGTNSPPTVLCLALIRGRFFVMQPPAFVLQGRAVLQAPLKPVNKGCEGCRMGPVLPFDCTWHAVIKWTIHPPLPFSDSLRRAGGGRVWVGCLCMESQARPAALALIDLEICATEVPPHHHFPATSFLWPLQ